MSQALSLIKGVWPDFSVTEKDLKNPTPEFLMKFYELFFDECGLLDLRLQTPSDVLHPESLNDALPIISTCAFLSYISSHWRGPQVGLEDIIDPIPKKTCKLLENYANYIVYIDVHVGNLALEEYEKAANAVTEKENLNKEIDDIKERLNEIAIRKTESSSELKKLDNKVIEIAKIKDHVHENCLQEEAKLKLMEDALSAQRQENCSLEKEIEKELEEIENLKGRIVSSPDTISQAIAELSTKKRDMESDQAHLRNRAKQLVLLDSNLEQISSMIQSKLSQVDDLVANLTFLRDLENGLMEDDAAMKSAKEKYDADTGKYRAIENDVAHLNQEINDFKFKSLEEQTALEESIQEAHKRKAEAEHMQIKHGAQQAVLAQEIWQLKEEIKDIERKERDSYKHFCEMEEKMHNQVKMCMNHLLKEAKMITLDR